MCFLRVYNGLTIYPIPCVRACNISALCVCVSVCVWDRVRVLAGGYSVIERPSVSSWTISSSAVQNVPQISQSDRYTTTNTHIHTSSYSDDCSWQIEFDIGGQRGNGSLILTDTVRHNVTPTNANKINIQNSHCCQISISYRTEKAAHVLINGKQAS